MNEASPTIQMPHVEIYTDGGCEPNPGPGGYGVVLVHPSYYYEYHLFCPRCQTAYHVDEAKRFIEQPPALF